MALVVAHGLLLFDMLLCLFWSVFVAPEEFTIVTNKGPGGPPLTEPTACVPCEGQKGWVSHLSVLRLGSLIHRSCGRKEK